MSACGEVWPRRGARPSAGPLVTRVLLGVLVLASALVGSFGHPPSAYAETGPVVQVHLDSLEPALPARDDTLTVRGTARNDSSRSIDDAHVVLWRHETVMTDTADLRTVAGQAPEDLPGTQMWTGDAYQPLTAQSLLTSEPSIPEPEGDRPAAAGTPAGTPLSAGTPPPTVDDADWEPGETRSFEISAPVSAFGFPATAGAYLIGAQVVGRPGGQALATLGEARVLLPLGAADSASTTGTNTIVSAVVLSSRPSMSEPGAFVDDHLADELGPAGRLTALLRAAYRDQVSWLVDPGLLDELASMAEGYAVRTPEGERPGTGQEAAAAWLAEFERLDRGRGYQVPFGIPDVSMLERNDLGEVMERAAAAARQVPAVQGLPLVAYSAAGFIDPQAVPLAERSAPVAVLASTADAQGALLEPLGTAPIVNFSPASAAGGPAPEPSGSTVQVRQRMLTESFLTARADSGATTVRVITTAAAALGDQTADTSWVTRRTLGELLQQQPRAWPGHMGYTPAHRAAELDPSQVETLWAIVAGYEAFIEMLAMPETASRTADGAIARTASSWWRGDPLGFARFAGPQAATIERLRAGEAVELTAQRSVIMSGQSGSFPMTVTNRLDQAIRVTLTFQSFQPQRLSIDDITGVVVPAGESITVNVVPHAVGNGPVRVWSQVLTPGGRPLSSRVWLTVEATDLGRVGWIIVVASGVVLLAMTTLRIRQVRRERREAPPPVDQRAPVHPTPPVVTIDPPSRPDPPHQGDVR